MLELEKAFPNGPTKSELKPHFKTDIVYGPILTG